VLILKDAFKDDELLTTAVCVRGETAPWCIPDDRRGARDLIPNAIQHPPFDTRNGRRHPRKACRVNDNPLRKI
jgi:hypothetical protein